MKKLKKLIYLILIIMLINACSPVETKVSEGGDGFKYRIVEIEGMPCMWVKRGIMDTSHAGLSCDWSKWEGK